MKKATLTILCLFLSIPCYARTITINADGTGDYPTIQAAIDAANDGDVIVLTPGTYTGNGNRDIDFLGKAITVRSTDPNDPATVAATIIDCEGTEGDPHRGFIFQTNEDSNSVLSGLTIQNGYAPPQTIYSHGFTFTTWTGGAIYCYKSSPSIHYCILRDNHAVYGGAISCNSPYVQYPQRYPSSPHILNCQIINNSAVEGGGGIYAVESESVIFGTLFENNTASVTGGALYVPANYNQIKIINCKIKNNKAGRWGGGTSRGYGVISNCTITNNSAENGGGIRRFKGKILRSIISGNKAKYSAGGIDYSDCSIYNCVISGNEAEFGGGALAACDGVLVNCTIVGNKSWDGAIGSSKLEISNCILANNIKYALWENWLAMYAPINYNLFYDNSTCDWFVTRSWTCMSGAETINSLYYAKGNIDIDPCFVSPGYWDPNGTPADSRDDIWVEGDYHLQPYSPCINAGDPYYESEPNETDLDGNPRIINSQIDMGAYEFNPNTPPVADAGSDKEAYAWLDGIAEVNLDGSGSYDDDGDELTYLWTWEIEPNIYEANGVNPIIELPVGEHLIELIVNDGTEDSEPNCTTVTVIEPLNSFLRIMPRTINRKSRQRHIMAWLSLPEGVTKDDIDENVPLTLYPGDIEASRQFIFENNRGGNTHTFILAFFKKSDLMNAVPDNGQVQLEAVGQLNTGRYFFGQRTIRIINPP